MIFFALSGKAHCIFDTCPSIISRKLKDALVAMG